ncbi:protein disulfide isomerase-like 1-3 [Olea europaea var. sylvestris]|uniref:protein disulfide isomerase-like 1-3 n=1 Tax=Olea europaea var. sylvestris TaxID=158386 RepID=UPI000C1D01A0|nr:protein disulfide isomerase-like 1-3 [Olea europaea var. sylvestris]
MEFAQKFDVLGFRNCTSMLMGVYKPYPSKQTKDAIINWVNKKTIPALYNITTTKEAERILAIEEKIVFGYLESLVMNFWMLRSWKMMLASIR